MSPCIYRSVRSFCVDEYHSHACHYPVNQKRTASIVNIEITATKREFAFAHLALKGNNHKAMQLMVCHSSLRWNDNLSALY